MEPDTKGMVGVIMVIIAIAALPAIFSGWIPGNCWTGALVMIVGVIGALLMIDDRRPIQ